MPLDLERARESVRVHVAEPLGLSIESAAAGIKQIVDARMADLLRTVTIEQGHDPREFVLYAFGGAGASHAPTFALDVVDEVLVPFGQSVFCAFGAVASDVKLNAARTLPKRCGRDGSGEIDLQGLEEIFSELESEADEALALQNIPPEKRSMQRIIEMRFIRQTKSLTVPMPASIEGLVQNFLTAYEKRYGEEAIPDSVGFEFVTYVVEARGSLSRPEITVHPPVTVDASAALKGRRPVYDLPAKAFVETPVYDGNLLQSGNEFSGPAIVEYVGTTVAIPSDRRVTIDEWLSISIRRENV